MKILMSVNQILIYVMLTENVSIPQDRVVRDFVRENSDITFGIFCVNTPYIGTYECQCNEGYKGDGYQCENIDECTERVDYVCGTHSTCIDNVGSFKCVCDTGFAGNITCRDIDECVDETHNCAGDAVCVNNEGSFTCTCATGFESTHVASAVSATEAIECVDTNECKLGTHRCITPNSYCENTEGKRFPWPKITDGQWKRRFREPTQKERTCAYAKLVLEHVVIYVKI